MNHAQAHAREQLAVAGFGRHCEHRVTVRAGDVHDVLDLVRELEACNASLGRELAAAKTQLLEHAVVTPIPTPTEAGS